MMKYGSGTSFVTTGIPGLDDILGGGLTPNCIYLIEGNPGSGKTTLGLQFLLEGVRKGEKTLYVTLSETKKELDQVAQSHGMDLSTISISELIPSEESLLPEAQYKMFHPSEVELSETTKKILSQVDQLEPVRLVFDSLSELRLLAQNPLRYRRQILALKQFFVGRQCTVLFLDDRTSEVNDLQLQSIAHGVIILEQLSPEYGSDRRRMRVLKMRGIHFRGGYHDFVIERGGLRIFPRLIAAEHNSVFHPGHLKSGISEFDKLLGGGIDMGASVLMVGPAGSGKSTLCAQFAVSAAKEGKNTLMLVFDERQSTLLKRTDGIDIHLREWVTKGSVILRQVDPAQLSPGELVQMIRRSVEEKQVKIVIIDSLNGYLNAMPNEQYLVVQLHELFSYLNQMGVTAFLTVAQFGIIGTIMKTPVDASYLADTIILLRYFEWSGAVKKAISVVKRRGGHHEETIRAFSITSEGVVLDEPLEDFQGILTGTPVLIENMQKK